MAGSPIPQLCCSQPRMRFAARTGGELVGDLTELAQVGHGGAPPASLADGDVSPFTRGPRRVEDESDTTSRDTAALAGRGGGIMATVDSWPADSSLRHEDKETRAAARPPNDGPG